MFMKLLKILEYYILEYIIKETIAKITVLHFQTVKLPLQHDDIINLK